MKIRQIEVENFRLLKDVKIVPEEVLSLVIGKNNSGKTSLLDILRIFLKGESFCFDDFNIDSHKALSAIPDKSTDEIIAMLNSITIRLKIYIEYSAQDSLENISEFMLSLDPKDNFIVLAFEYGLRVEKIADLTANFSKYKAIKGNKDKSFLEYLKKNISAYYQVKVKSLEYGNETNSVEVKNFNNVIRFDSIGAKRRVSEDKSSYNLSTIVSSYYHKNANLEAFVEKKEQLEASLSEIDKTLTDQYPTTFEELLNTLKQFGINDSSSSSEIQIISDISSQNIITHNSKVVYEQSDYQLPESYHGLGYINLIYMILEIHNKLDIFKAGDDTKIADINLLFLEEPEAHMHPQMQYIFIHHIKEMLITKTSERDINLQTIISTHSPHIASQCEFADIKYFDIVGTNEITVKSLSDFIEDEDPENIKFLKRYLTVHNSELFFANKAILIEGPTERLLMPYMLRAIDDQPLNVKDTKTGEILTIEKPIEIKMLSQNISVIVVGGAYAHRFKKLLGFLDIKTLIITDLDSVGDDNKACKVQDGTKSSNKAISDYLGDKSLGDLIGLASENKIIDNLFKVTYQIPEERDGYIARSFEDAWINANKEFVKSKKASLPACFVTFDDATDIYEVANKIPKKTDFALDIIFSTDLDNLWTTPKYIKEGLEWLAN